MALLTRLNGNYIKIKQSLAISIKLFELLESITKDILAQKFAEVLFQ